jgi:AcrR family transcriptional regulator
MARGARRKVTPVRPRPATRAPNRRRLDAREREQQIIDAAVRFFAEVGFAGQTRELAQRLGITQPLLYRYFPTKQDLIERVFEEIYLKRIDPAWRKQLTDRTRPLQERLRTFYAQYAAATYRYEWIRVYMFSGLMGEALNRRYIQVVEDRILKPLCAEIRAYCGLPEAGASDMELEQVWLLHGGLFYYAVRKHIYHSRVADDFDAVVAQAVETFLNGLQKRRGRERRK